MGQAGNVGCGQLQSQFRAGAGAGQRIRVGQDLFAGYGGVSHGRLPQAQFVRRIQLFSGSGSYRPSGFPLEGIGLLFAPQPGRRGRGRRNHFHLQDRPAPHGQGSGQAACLCDAGGRRKRCLRRHASESGCDRALLLLRPSLRAGLEGICPLQPAGQSFLQRRRGLCLPFGAFCLGGRGGQGQAGICLPQPAPLSGGRAV